MLFRSHFLLQCVKVNSLSRVQLIATPWTAAYQAPLSMGFSRQEYWSGLPFTSPGDLPDPGNEPGSPTLQADSLPSEPPGKPLRQSRVQTLALTLNCWVVTLVKLLHSLSLSFFSLSYDILMRINKHIIDMNKFIFISYYPFWGLRAKR